MRVRRAHPDPGGGGGELPLRPFPVRRADNTVAVPFFRAVHTSEQAGASGNAGAPGRAAGAYARRVGHGLHGADNGAVRRVSAGRGVHRGHARKRRDRPERGGTAPRLLQQLRAGLYNRSRGRGRIRLVQGGGVSILHTYRRGGADGAYNAPPRRTSRAMCTDS